MDIPDIFYSSKPQRVHHSFEAMQAKVPFANIDDYNNGIKIYAEELEEFYRIEKRMKKLFDRMHYEDYHLLIEYIFRPLLVGK